MPSGSGDDTWQKIWKLTVPPKVKVFWWRVLHEFLPAKEILHHRHIEPTAFCDLCGADSESIKHILVDYTIAKAFWHEIKALTGVKLPRLHPNTWASDLLSTGVCTDKERGILITGMYSLWLQRNKRRHGEPPAPVTMVVRWSLDIAFDLWQLSATSRPEKDRQVQRWKPPDEGWVKCNTDGAFYPGVQHGAIGLVLRDASGNFVAGRAQWYQYSLDALTVEAMACRDGAILARDNGVQQLVLETDCQELVKLWQEGSGQRSRIAPIIREAQDICSGFNRFVFSFISRSCNRVAHTLAKQVTGENRLGEWHVAPSCVEHLVIEDCNPS